MIAVQQAAESAVRAMLKSLAARSSPSVERDSQGRILLRASDYMDNGLKVALSIAIDPLKGDAHFDFTGTSRESLGNLNAPVSVTSSAIIYALRAMVNEEIPLNDGIPFSPLLLLPFLFVFPSSFLSPASLSPGLLPPPSLSLRSSSVPPSSLPLSLLPSLLSLSC